MTRTQTDPGRARSAPAAVIGTGGDDTSLDAPLRQLLGRTPITCPPDMPVRSALGLIDREGVGSIVVVDGDERPVGIFTLRDVLPRVVLPGIDLSTPIERVMTTDPVTLAPSDFGYEAALLMAAHGFRHICVTDEGRLVGVVSERDLFTLQRVGLANLSQSISRAPDVETLVRMASDIRRLTLQMMAEGASVEQLTGLITALNDRLTRRTIELCVEQNEGPVPPFTWLAFGSEGREEQTLYTDQDNGLLFEAETDAQAESLRSHLLPLAQRINQALGRCGFPLCKGNVMASNPELCLSTRQWRARFVRWIEQGTPEHLLNASIFFDFRPLLGDPRPVFALREWLLGVTARQSRFLRMMAENALNNRPPIGFLGTLKVSGARHQFPRTIDLKFQGLTPFVDGARILALQHGVAETNTRRRLLGVAESGAVDRGDAGTWTHALDIIQRLRMRHHRALADAGMEFNNRINPDALDKLDRRMVKESFRQGQALQSHLKVAFGL